jgi:hypothetical protein
MTAYKKNLLAWACIMVSAFSIGCAALYISNWFLIPFAIIIYTANFFLKKITCPNCETPVTYEGEGAFSSIRIPSAFFRTKCANCGWDLDKNL